ncbi:MAG: hypothetical protein LBV53_01925 [Mycoplasmataceae bacterium]|nr:hypothetical protein [Mycoplasmataceae bacterium]
MKPSITQKQSIVSQVFHWATVTTLLICIALILAIGVSTKFDFVIHSDGVTATVSMGLWIDDKVGSHAENSNFKLNAAGISCVTFATLTVVFFITTLILNVKQSKANVVSNVFLSISTILTVAVVTILVLLKPSFWSGQDVETNVSIWTTHSPTKDYALRLTLNWKGICCLIAGIASLLSVVTCIITYIFSTTNKKASK